MTDHRESTTIRRKLAARASPEIVALCLTIPVVLVAVLLLRGVLS